MLEKIHQTAREKMVKAIETLEHNFQTVRTGRASLHILDNVMVNAYGVETPIRQVATLSVPDARTMLIQPWDRGVMASVEKAILAANLGLTPNNDGKVIRLSVPPLTEERRKELVKVVKHMAEEERVAVRNVRRHTNEEIKKTEKQHEISEDNRHKMLKKVQELTDEYIKKIDELLQKKEAEIMEV
ncbi:MAG: ribosome recycling factor [bacterium]